MSDVDRQLQSKKTYYYRGKAKINLRHFDLHRNTPGVRTISDKHVKSLINTFETEGCLRLNPDNFAKVLINDEVLRQSLTRQELEDTDLLEAAETHFLDLPSDARLTVLHGKHRLLAAESFLWDKWWIVQLYSDGITGVWIFRFGRLTDRRNATGYTGYYPRGASKCETIY